MGAPVVRICGSALTLTLPFYPASRHPPPRRFCCAPCAAGDVAAQTGGNYFAACALPYCVPFLGLCVRCRDRAAVKEKFSIDDGCNNAGTCALLCCCNACALAQEIRELAHNSTGASKDMGVFGKFAATKPDFGTLGEAIPSAIAAATSGAARAQAAAKEAQAAATAKPADAPAPAPSA